MARAGYCSGCGTYVYLRPDGYCVNGHSPQYVSNIYEAPDASAPPAAFAVVPGAPAQPAYQPQPAQPAYQPPAQPAYPAAAAAPAYPAAQAAPAYGAPQYAPQPAPKKKRGGLIAMIVILLLLACGGAAAWAGVVFGILPNPGDLLSSPGHQKASAAGDFVQAFVTADPVLFRKTLPTDAANAANPTYWIKKLSEASGAGKLESKTWNGDVLTLVYAANDGTKRQFVLTPDASSDKVSVVATDVGSKDAGSPMNFLMVKELSGYKVLAMVAPDGTEFIRFTAAQIKKFETDNP